MIEIVIGIGVLLVIAILFALFRVYTLISVSRGANKNKVGTGNKVNAYLFLVFLIFFGGLFFWYSYVNFDKYDVPIASEHGILIDDMFWLTMWITGAVFVITHILLFVFAFRYRHKEKASAYFYPDNAKLEVFWTVVPATVLALLVLSGLTAWNTITADAPDDAEVVEIMGYQFAWSVRYPGKDNQLGKSDYRLIDASNQFGMDFTDRASFDDFIPREIHVPKGKPVLLKIRARDVLHSVFAPHFRLKMDAVPGMPTRFWFVPNKTTEEMREELGDPDFNYEIACAEVCGRGHFSMRMVIVVDTPEDYEKWKSEQEPWLSRNPEYLAKVPSNLQELAMTTAGIEDDNSDEFNKETIEVNASF